MLEASNLSFAYNAGRPDAIPALEQVSLRVSPSELVAVIGQNGSGKSTLAKLLAAILMPSAGSIAVDGLSSVPENAWEIRRRVGMVFQNPDDQLIANTVIDDVSFGPENLGLSRAEIERRVRGALTALGLDDVAHAQIAELSNGEKQRTAIAGVLAMQPSYVILDEPTTMLTPQSARDLITLIHELRDSAGLAVLHITHFMAEAARFDRVVVMDHGRVLLDGPPREVFAHHDELRAIGLAVPLVTALSRRLRARGVALPEVVLTAQELADALAPANSDVRDSDDARMDDRHSSAGDQGAVADQRLGMKKQRPSDPPQPQNASAQRTSDSPQPKNVSAQRPSDSPQPKNAFAQRPSDPPQPQNASAQRTSDSPQPQNASVQLPDDQQPGGHVAKERATEPSEAGLLSPQRASLAESAPLIDIHDLHFSYLAGTPLEREALRGVTCALYPGETLAVLGGTQAGKSTLIEFFNALRMPAPGHVFFEGQDIALPGFDLDRLRGSVGMVFQQPEAQLFEDTVGKDVSYVPRRRGLSPAESREIVERALNDVGLDYETFRLRYIYALSGGQKRRVAIAGVLAAQPRILILDEPTAGLDPRGRAELIELIGELKRRLGLAIVLVGNAVDALAELADRAIVLHAGRVVMEGELRTLLRRADELHRMGLELSEPAEIALALRARFPGLPTDLLRAEELEAALLRLVEPIACET